MKERALYSVLLDEQKAKISGGIYHKLQIELTYNSNHIEGSRLTEEQTRYIFETNTIGISQQAVNVDDIIETANHFKCIDYVILNAEKPLSEEFIKKLHEILKTATSQSKIDGFAVGDYKIFPNEVGGRETTAPENVHNEIKRLLEGYNSLESITIDDIIDFHQRFESIHPFQDGNGRTGRLIILKECLKNNIVPFVITDDMKIFYYRGLSMWNTERGYLRDTCLAAQDNFKQWLDYYKIKY